MFSSCIYCGRIHGEGRICKRKPIKKKKIDDAVRFRNSSAWNRKRQQIKKRDSYWMQRHVALSLRVKMPGNGLTPTALLKLHRI